MQGGYSKLDGTDWYYEAQFWSEMPDLNLGSQAVRDDFDKIVDFWLDLGWTDSAWMRQRVLQRKCG